MKEKLLYLVLVLMMVVPLYAQSQNAADYTIKGQVVDSLSNETVPYATLNIALASAPQKAVKLLACDDDGKFTTTLKQPGKYIISMQSLGKVPAVKYFTLSENKKSLDLGKLYMNDDTQQLNEVTVVAQKPLVTVEVDKITYSLDDDPEAKTSNALEMFRKVPMVTVDGEDKIQLKGSSNYKIYMNGKPSNLLSGENASDVLKSMPASSIKNIEVITDPGSKYDAEGVGGIINIITTKNAMQGYTGTVRANASSLGSFGGGGYVSLKVGSLGLTANYGYNKRNSPWNDSHSERETDKDRLAEDGPTKLIEDGRSKYKGPFQYGYLEASYEIDTLNLISVGANLFRGKSENLSELDAVLNPMNVGINEQTAPIYRYHRNSNSESTFGSTDLNVDYQHSTSKKDELLTISYRFSQSPNDSESKTELSDVVTYYMEKDYPKWNINDASTIEHTGQVDYTTPLFNKQTLEAGVKYINRQNKSNTLEQVYDDETGIWVDQKRDNSQFHHTQHIYSAYLGYLVRLDKFGIKAGVRGEGTSLDAKFALKPDMDFNSNYFDVVPNATLTYQLDMSTQIRLGYNMRIQRPGIWYLNPYINDVNPQNISQGNPNLDSEKSNNVNLNFSKFTQKFSINASLSYTFVNNPIERHTFTANFPESDPRSQYNGAMWSTYDNVGKKQQVGMFLYGNWSPTTWFRIYMNGGLDYVSMKAPTLNKEKDGVSGRIFAGTQFTLPKDFRINLNGGYFSPWIQLQSEMSPFYFAGLNVSKDFLKKKLSVSLGANNPFWKTMKMETTTKGDGFHDVSTNWRSAREFRFSISYRFGTMKGQIKKVRRGISNDDSKGGGENNQGGGEQAM